MNWVFLLLAIAFEILGTVNMKLAHGFTRLVPSVLVFAMYGLSIAALTMALRSIEVGVCYAIWSGLGTAAITAIGVLWFNETLTTTKAISIILIIIGVVGLNLHKAGH